MKQLATTVFLTVLAGCACTSDGALVGGENSSGGSSTTDGDASGNSAGTSGGGNGTDSDWESTDAASTSTGGSAGTDGTGSSDGTDGTDGNSNPVSVVSSFALSHRNGQTFLTWTEAGAAGYHVYRHNAPITSGNLGSATRLTEKWGALGQDTSVNIHGTPAVPDNFVIDELSPPLRDDQGLFVHTTQEGEQGNAYYAVTVVENGSENRNISSGINASNQPVSESVSTPRPVLTLSLNGGRGQLYTQYMDYANWNPTFKGYAFNFAVALPADFNASRTYPLMVSLHAYSGRHKFLEQTEFNWPVIQLFPSDPGGLDNAINTWWYGFAADHNYQTDGPIPRSGTVENFTEQRVIAATNYVINDSQFRVNPDLVHVLGGSMGASGALSLGMRYPSLFSGIYASQPMTNYATDPVFQSDLVQLWGEQSTNLPIVNAGQNSADIQRYGADGSQPTQVWNWMNHQEQLRRRRSDNFAYLMVDHGKADNVIDWQSQGRPMAQTFTDARVGFAAYSIGGFGHNWTSFASVVTSMFGLGYADEAPWRYPLSQSFPGIHNASGSGALNPADTGDDQYNINFEWSFPANSFHQGIVDTANRYEISIRSMSGNQTADITPRRTTAFRPAAGQQCAWSASNNNNGNFIESGSATVDGSGLLTIPSAPIVTGSGSRLTLTCP